MTGRKRLTFAKLREITAIRRHRALKENIPLNKVEIIIPFLCWMELRMDRETFAYVNFAVTEGSPRHVECNGIRCVIEQYPGELVALGDED